MNAPADPGTEPSPEGSSEPELPLLRRLARYAPLLLGLVLVVAYLPSLAGGFSTLDDAWLIRDNPYFVDPSWTALWRIWTRFDFDTRYTLGAEYLPVRDTSHWLEARLFGVRPGAMRVVGLCLYLGALWLLRGALRASFGSAARAVRGRTAPLTPGASASALAGAEETPALAAELSLWLFALHPVHVESVAWLAGRKDLLALFWVAAALRVYARRARGVDWLVPVLLGAAYLSKSMAVTAPAWLLALDLLARRRPRLVPILASSLLGVLVLVVATRVGATVGMVGAPHGGSRLVTAGIMGRVVLRYVELVVWPPALAIFHEVGPSVGSWPLALGGYGLLVAWAAAGCLAWRRGSGLVAASWVWWVASLLPVSQVFFPLQNVMADRYLLFAVMGPALLGAHVLSAPIERCPVAAGRAAAKSVVAATAAVVVALFAALALGTLERAALFADDRLLYLDAYRKEPGHPTPPYQLGWLCEQRREWAQAAEWYERSRRVAPAGSDAARRATNNLAIVLGQAGRLGEARAILEQGHRDWPEDPKLMGNLAEIMARRGEEPQARRLYEELSSRHPNYTPGRASYRKRYGVDPPVAR